MTSLETYRASDEQQEDGQDGGDEKVLEMVDRVLVRALLRVGNEKDIQLKI